MRPPLFRASFDSDELVVDNFAGGGGTSTGIEAALGRPVDLAINHDAAAIAMHRANHPETKHFCESIWEVDPRDACGSRPVGLAWFSPDCTHFSRAKGTQPLKKEIRGLAWVVIRWAATVRPRVIVVENVEEFQTWGPLRDDGRPDPDRLGETFREWLADLRALGYAVEYRALVAADYGAPTTRRRFFLIARRDGVPIVWPRASHGEGCAAPWAPASEIIDWSLPCPSIFERKRPLAEATLRRIAAGIRRYVIEAADPFIVPVTHQGDARVHGIDEPVRTITGATAAFLTKYYGTSIGSSAHAPLPTVTANGKGGGHLAEVRALLRRFDGQRTRGQSLQLPLHTITTAPRFGLVTIHGEQWAIADIGMRMLQPHELFAAHAFPGDYIIAPELGGKPLTKTAQIKLVGNSVPPPFAERIVLANVRGEAEAA